MADRNRRIVIASIVGFAQRGSATLGTLLIFPYVLRSVGLAGFALWGVAASLSMIINFADFGLGPMIINGISRDLAADDIAAARRLFGAAMTVGLLIALTLALASPLVYVLAGRDVPAQVYAIVALGVGLNVPLGLANPTWIGLQQGWMTAFWEFAQTLLFVAGLYVCGLWSSDVRLFSGVIYLTIVLANLFNVVTLLKTRPALHPLALPAPWVDIRPILAPSLKFFALTTLDALTYLFDATIALQVAGAGAAAQMAVVQRMAVAVTGVLLILAQYQWPFYVEAWTRRDLGWMRRALAWSIAGIALAALGVFAVLGRFGPALCRIWLGRDIGFHAATFGWLAAWILVMGTARLLSTMLNAMNVLGYQIAVSAVFILISLLLKIVLPRYIGVDGILLGVVIPALLLLIPLLGGRVWWQMHRLDRKTA